MPVSIVSRYLAREMVQASVAVTIVLVTVLFTNRFIRYLGDAASGSLPSDSILLLMGYKALSYTPLILPGSLFLGIVLAMGRFYRDSEMSAFNACGVGPGQIYRAVALLAGPALVLVAWLALSIAPWAVHQGRIAEGNARDNVEIDLVRPGRFLESAQTEGVFYIEGINADGDRMEKVFLQTTQGEQKIVLSSEYGQIRVDSETGDRYLVLLDGHRYDGIPGQASWRMMDYSRHGVRIARGEPEAVDARLEGMRTAELWISDDPRAAAELQWRLSMPLMVLALALMSVPLSKGTPRDGRYGRVLLAVLIFALYANALAVGQGWLEDGAMPVSIGLWWVHAVAFGFTGLWLLQQYGRGLRSGTVPA